MKILKQHKLLHCINTNFFLFKNNILYLGLPSSEKVFELILVELLLFIILDKDKSLSILINSSSENHNYYQAQYSHLNLITCVDCINRNFNYVQTIVLGKGLGSIMYLLTTINKNKRCSFKNSTLSIESVPYYFYSKNDFTYKKNLIEAKKTLNTLYYLNNTYTTFNCVERDVNVIDATEALRLGILDTILI
uniref:Clp protease n=1 Tax=Lotharella vacuolata TaxID=74820 RepID=A0A0H5BKX1_9EUKA|nr:clp protease [Lotharella vacuolata]